MAAMSDNARVLFPPPAVPVLTVLAGAALQWLWPVDLDWLLPAPGRYWAGGAIALGAFLGIGLWAMITMKRTGQSPNPWKTTPSILAHGPYRFTRNPMYVQLVLICLGFAVMLANVWILLLTPVAAWVLLKVAILPEEAYLEAKFGEEYLAYKRRVRRWI